MKIKKTILDDLIEEEVRGMIKESDGWDAFKRGIARGFTQGGKRKSVIAQMVAGANLPSEAKNAVSALNELEEALENMAGRPDVGRIATAGQDGKSSTAAAAQGMEGGVSVEALAKVAAGMRQDIHALFAQLGADAPEAPAMDDGPPETSSEEASLTRRREKMSAAMKDSPSEDNINESLRRRIRSKLRAARFTS